MINNTLFTGKFLIHEPEMLSTNDFGKNLISKTNPIDGTVIITDAQTKGKGQGNNSWVTKAGKNLTFSIIYNTNFLRANQQFYISMAVANGVFNAMQKLAPNEQLNIKWPNDIICNNYKIGGILIENTIMGQYLKNSIIGIGINVNQTNFEGLPFANSLYNILQKENAIKDVLELICQCVEHEYLNLKKGYFKSTISSYNNSLYRKGEMITFQVDEKEKIAQLTEVNEFGQLGLASLNQVKFYNHGQINWLWHNEVI